MAWVVGSTSLRRTARSESHSWWDGVDESAWGKAGVDQVCVA